MSSSNESELNSMLQSITSSVIIYCNKKHGLDLPKNSIALRAEVKSKLEDLINKVSDVKPDETRWEVVKNNYFYDVYLDMRRAEGTLTLEDEVRTGLSMCNFLSEMEYYKHCERVNKFRKESNGDREKQCKECGLVKPAHKFKHRGGATCNACQNKKYRDRKKDKAMIGEPGEQEE